MHVYNQAEGGVKVDQSLFPLDEGTLLVDLKDNPRGTWKAFGRELQINHFGPINGWDVPLVEEREQRGVSVVQKRIAPSTPLESLKAKRVKNEHASIQDGNAVAMFDAAADSEGPLRLMQDYSVEECWRLFYNFKEECPTLVLERVQQMCLKRDHLTAKPSKTLLVTVRA